MIVKEFPNSTKDYKNTEFYRKLMYQPLLYENNNDTTCKWLTQLDDDINKGNIISPELPATTLTFNDYRNMFNNEYEHTQNDTYWEKDNAIRVLRNYNGSDPYMLELVEKVITQNKLQELTGSIISYIFDCEKREKEEKEYFESIVKRKDEDGYLLSLNNVDKKNNKIKIKYQKKYSDSYANIVNEIKFNTKLSFLLFLCSVFGFFIHWSLSLVFFITFLGIKLGFFIGVEYDDFKKCTKKQKKKIIRKFCFSIICWALSFGILFNTADSLYKHNIENNEKNPYYLEEFEQCVPHEFYQIKK